MDATGDSLDQLGVRSAEGLIDTELETVTDPEGLIEIEVLPDPEILPDTLEL